MASDRGTPIFVHDENTKFTPEELVAQLLAKAKEFAEISHGKLLDYFINNVNLEIILVLSLFCLFCTGNFEMCNFQSLSLMEIFCLYI